MQRLFVALAMPEDIRDRLAGPRAGLPGARWVPPENLHLTLRFVGEADGAAARDAADALSRIDAGGFDLALSGVGAFESGGRARSVWAGTEPEPALDALQRKVDGALARAGVRMDTRRFRPHVTLARFSGARAARLGPWLAANGLFRAGPFAVEGFTLFESALGRGGSVYRPLVEFPLRPAAPAPVLPVAP